jgi:hypothetical protein
LKGDLQFLKRVKLKVTSNSPGPTPTGTSFLSTKPQNIKMVETGHEYGLEKHGRSAARLMRVDFAS